MQLFHGCQEGWRCPKIIRKDHKQQQPRIEVEVMFLKYLDSIDVKQRSARLSVITHLIAMGRSQQGKNHDYLNESIREFIKFMTIEQKFLPSTWYPSRVLRDCTRSAPLSWNKRTKPWFKVHSLIMKNYSLEVDNDDTSATVSNNKKTSLFFMKKIRAIDLYMILSLLLLLLW